jgi:prenylated cyclic peptide (anacyclamide/piricyclamide family)
VIRKLYFSLTIIYLKPLDIVGTVINFFIKNKLIGGFYPMKTKKLTPRNSVPVQRENAATVSRDGNAIAPQWLRGIAHPFAGDDAE